MAKQLEYFKQEYAAIEKEFEAAQDEMEKSSGTRGHHDAMIETGAKAIGERVRALREAGKPGTALNDFLSDAEVKGMVAEVDGHLAQIDKEITRVKSLSAGTWKKSVTRYDTLKRDLTAEIAARKKELTTKVGLGNKSLPDMEKLLVQVNNPNGMYKLMKAARDYVTTTPSLKDPAYYRKERDKYIATELSKSKDKALSEAQAELFERLLVDRNFNKYSNQARTLQAAVEKGVAEARAALEARKPTELLAAKIEAAQQMKALDNLVAQYVQARQQIGDAAILTGKGGDKTIAGIKQMIARRDKARTELDQVANARLDD